MGLILFSFFFLIIWGYNKYFKSEYQEDFHVKISAEAPDSTGGMKKDSLSRDTAKVPVNITSDTAATDFQSALDSIAEMQQELAGIISASDTRAELEIIKKKLDEVNRKIDALEKMQASMQQDNLKLKNTVAELSTPKKEAASPSTKKSLVTDKKEIITKPVISKTSKKSNAGKEATPGSSKKVTTENKKENRETQIKNNNASTIPASNKIKSAAISSIKLGASYSQGNDEYKTNESVLAEKFSGTIVFTNASNPPGEITDVYLIVYRPDGKLLNSGWESGSFSTLKGKMIYTTRISFDCGPDESKNVGFSIYSDRFQKGRYSLYAYVNGKLAGSAFKILK